MNRFDRNMLLVCVAGAGYVFGVFSTVTSDARREFTKGSVKSLSELFEFQPWAGYNSLTSAKYLATWWPIECLWLMSVALLVYTISAAWCRK